LFLALGHDDQNEKPQHDRNRISYKSKEEDSLGKVYPEIETKLADFIQRQHMFFVATAPNGSDGHVNMSPKGLESFRILGPRTVGYLDLTGSGAETIAHLRQNGRITIMFCAFDGPPKILRLYGHGTVNEPGDDGFTELAKTFPQPKSTRSIITVDVDRVADACGYGVPVMDFKSDRESHFRWADHLGPDGLKAYKEENNFESIDGLAALSRAQ